MTLWIRSQEGTLGKPILIRPAGSSLHVKWEGNYDTFENYKTEKRALEVLDEIQDIIISTSIIPLENNDAITCGSAKVYEMPEE